MDDIDLTSMDDEQLDNHRREVLAEIERRSNREQIPNQIRTLAERYREGGGDTTILRDAIEGAEL